MANNHIVARSMTKAWEYPKRNLRYYDFKEKRILKYSSESVLAGKGLFSGEVDRALGQRIESYVGPFRKKVINEANVSTIEKYNEYRALYLSFMLQIKRYVAYASNDFSSLEQLATAHEDTFNFIIQQLEKKYCLYLVKIPHVFYIYQNNIGCFAIPFRHFDFIIENIMCMPITPKCCLFLMPKGIVENEELKRKFDELTEYTIGRYSIGFDGHFNKIIIPYELKDNPDDEIIESITANRRLNNELKDQLDKPPFKVISFADFI